MKEFLLKILALTIIVLALAYGSVTLLSWWPYRNVTPDVRYSQSKLAVIPHNQQYDIVLMGGSHAEVITGASAYDSVSSILNKKFFNLGKGQGSGIIPMKMLAEYFFYKGNSTKEVVYFFDDQVLFTEVFNEKPLMLRSEPFDLKFFQLAIKHHIKQSAIKLKPQKALTGIDSTAVKMRVENMYFDGMDTTATLTHYEGLLLDFLLDLKSKGIKVTLVVPPTLLGNLPGHKYQQRIMKKWRDQYQIPSLDLTNTITDATCYMDHDHLNAKGSALLMRNYVKPFLDLQTGN
jgi:hypothetical protein